MRVLCVIPARMGSSRFPGKPLASIKGRPMIEWVYEGVRRSPLVHTTVVATCDEPIRDHIVSIGGKAVMTSSAHERASDRCAEALQIIEVDSGESFEVVVMVQGDEPLVRPEMIEEALAPFQDDETVEVVNLLGRLDGEGDLHDPNCIKVVCDAQMNALYMSRAPIPASKWVDVPTVGKQVCIIPFRRQFLLDYTNMSPTPLEVAESIDMLRVLENGFSVRMVPTRWASIAVDAPRDIAAVEQVLG